MSTPHHDILARQLQLRVAHVEAPFHVHEVLRRLRQATRALLLVNIVAGLGVRAKLLSLLLIHLRLVQLDCSQFYRLRLFVFQMVPPVFGGL